VIYEFFLSSRSITVSAFGGLDESRSRLREGSAPGIERIRELRIHRMPQESLDSGVVLNLQGWLIGTEEGIDPGPRRWGIDERPAEPVGAVEVTQERDG